MLMIDPERANTERIGLEKLKAYLQRSNLAYTEERKGNTTILEIKRKEKEDEMEVVPQRIHPKDTAS